MEQSYGLAHQHGLTDQINLVDYSNWISQLTCVYWTDPTVFRLQKQILKISLLHQNYVQGSLTYMLKPWIGAVLKWLKPIHCIMVIRLALKSPGGRLAYEMIRLVNLRWKKRQVNVLVCWLRCSEWCKYIACWEVDQESLFKDQQISARIFKLK